MIMLVLTSCYLVCCIIFWIEIRLYAITKIVIMLSAICLLRSRHCLKYVCVGVWATLFVVGIHRTNYVAVVLQVNLVLCILQISLDKPLVLCVVAWSQIESSEIRFVEDRTMRLNIIQALTHFGKLPDLPRSRSVFFECIYVNVFFHSVTELAL